MKWLNVKWILLLILISPVLSGWRLAEEDSSKANGKIKSFDKIIKPEAQIQEGLFTVYQQEEEVYFQIPDSLMERDMLMSSRIAQVSDPSKAFAGEMRRGPILIKFRKDDKNIYIMKEVLNYELDGDDNSMEEAFNRNSILPVYAFFPIKAIGRDGQSSVINVTDFFSKEIPIITPFQSKGKPGTLDTKISSVSRVQVFENNIEIQANLNYTTKTSPFRALVNRSILLLPKEPMMPRFYDRRMNYFANGRKIFNDDGDVSQSVEYINRYRVEPKPEDRDRYFNGELVEPAKPIIVYVDNGLPDRWRPYVKMGIEDWQKAFEAIGFKNAVIAKDFPQDSSFNPDDLQNTCFRYVTNSTINAMGPRWVDPRSGEIIKGDIIWYHNVIQKLHDWRLVQCAAVEEGARERVFSDELMGRLIRYAASHEMGHVLGFQHNMRASYSYPVDSLRSSSFTQKYGTTPSIMDYARFNYIAQPGDEGVELTPPAIGVFDYHAIKWGYQPLEDIQDPADEYATLNQWLLEKSDDPMYRFTPQFAIGISPDPAAQAESLGDDCIKAGTYGVKNAQFIMNHLVEWCTVENQGYDYLNRIYKETVNQYVRYLEHAISYLGGAYEYFGVEGEGIPLQTPVDKTKQKEALSWIMNELTSNEWILNKDVEERLGSKQSDWFKMNVEALDKLMSGFIFQRLQTSYPNYPVNEYLGDLSRRIWSYPVNRRNLTQMEMVLQQSYIRNLIALAKSAQSKTSSRTKTAPSGEWVYDNALTMGSAAKINFIDHFVAMGALEELQKAQAVVKKRIKGQDKAHYELLNQIIKGVNLN